MKSILTFGILTNMLAVFALSGCTPTSKLAEPKSTQADTPPTTLTPSYTPYTTEQGFKRHAFCADTTLKQGQSIAIDVKLPQQNPNGDTFERYDLLIFPAVKVKMINPSGVALTMHRFANRFGSLSPAKTLVSPNGYDGAKSDLGMAYARHEGIYTLTALQNKTVKICVRNSGFGTKLSGESYPSTPLDTWVSP